MSDHLRRAYLTDSPLTLHGNLPHDDNPDPVTMAFAAIPNRDPRHDRQNQYLTNHDSRYLYNQNRPLRPDGTLNLRSKEWSGTSYMLAPCPNPSDSHETKSLVLENAIETIRSGTGKWRNKTDCLINHFNQPLVLTGAELETQPFHDYASPLYQYTFLQVLNATYRTINVPDPNGAAQTVHRFRTEARYVSAEMTINPRSFFNELGTDINHRIPGANTKTVLIRIPQETTPADGTTQLHIAFHDHVSLRNVRNMITTCTYIQEILQFGTEERGHFTQDVFEAWIDDTKQRTKFEIVTKLIRPAFVGDGLIETPINRLVKCKQITTNERGNGQAATVIEHYQRFTAILGQLNAEQLYPLNITETFFNSLSGRLQGKILRRNYRHPHPRTNQQHIQKLQDLRDLAVEEEQEMEANLQMVKTAFTTNNTPKYNSAHRPHVKTFMATTRSQEKTTATHYQQGLMANGTDNAEQQQYDPLLEQCHTLCHLIETESPNNPRREEDITRTFLSPAETALRQASGSERPIECWGCMNLPEFHRNRFHRFYDCPHKDHPEVRRNASINMRKARQQWETRRALEKDYYSNSSGKKRDASTMLTRTEVMSDWQQLGFESYATAQQIASAAALMAVDIPARRRQHMVREWVETQRYHQQRNDQDQPDQPQPRGHTFLSPVILTPKRATNDRAATGVAFHSAVRERLPLEISPTLPHCEFPIGPKEGQGKLKVALDSCAGVNIGDLDFHKAMANHFPELVANFKNLSEYGEEAVTIGGVEASAAGNLHLTHIIEYKTPYWYQGEPCTLAFGLSSKAAATAIVSINFLRKTKALWSYDDTAPSIHLTIWNSTIKANQTTTTPTTFPAEDYPSNNTGTTKTTRNERTESEKQNAGITHSATANTVLNNKSTTRIFAASAATQQEIKEANTRANDGSGPVKTDKRPYRPKVTSVYEEPPYLPDDDDTLELLYKCGGTAISKQKSTLAPRDPASIIAFDPDKHQKTLDTSVQWEDCPEELRPTIIQLIKKHWDVFAPEGLKNHIRGFVCHIDTGNAAPVCCKIPRYGPHEARVISELARGLEANGLIEEARSPWGAQVVLAAKPNQDHVHWSDYIWRLTVSYRKLNAVTRPFVYPARRCDDAARDIGPSKYFITMDFESGFWQVLLHPQSRDKTTFFVPGGQKRWTVMPMGCLNAHGTFCCLVDTMKRHWNADATASGIRDDIEVTLKGQRPWTDAEVIVDDVMLHSVNKDALIKYFEIVLGTLQHYQVTVKLKKCRFFPNSAEFVGMDVEADGNRPANSKMQALIDLRSTIPQGLEDLRKLIGFIGFYQDWIANYELRITPWRQHVKTLRAREAEGKEATLHNIWTEDDTEMMKTLIDELVARPVLARPNYTRRFYLKTDWCRLGMAAVLLQADPTDTEATKAEQAEQNGGPCVFDKSTHKLRLRPLAFASRRCTEQEGIYHSFTGEAATGVWAIEKYQRHLFGREFTWMTDCNGLRQFFDGADVPTHLHQRMRQRLLRYMFTVVHRPARFMLECDALTRYNRQTDQWRTNEADWKTTPNAPITTAALWANVGNVQPSAIAFANWPVQETGPNNGKRTLLASKAANNRSIWIINAGVTTTITALHNAGIEFNGHLIENRPEWQRRTTEPQSGEPEYITTAQLTQITEHPHIQQKVDWIITHEATATSESQREQYHRDLRTTIRMANKLQLMGVISIARRQGQIKAEHDDIPTFLRSQGLHTLKATVKAHRYGAACEGEFVIITATRRRDTLETFHLQQKEAEPLAKYIDQATNSANSRAPDEDTQIHNIRRPQTHEKQTMETNGARIAAMVQRQQQGNDSIAWRTAWTPCFDIAHPGPDLTCIENQWYESPFAIETDTQNAQARTHTVRGIRAHELIRAYGIDEDSAIQLINAEPEIILEQLRGLPPYQLTQAIITGLWEAEIRTTPDKEPDHAEIHDTYEDIYNVDEALRGTLRTMLAAELNQTTTIPLPTTASWQDHTENDHDTAILLGAIREGTMPTKDQFNETGYYAELINHRLEEEDGIIYRHETNPRKAMRHLRTRVAPKALRQAIFTALHAAPMGGHTGYAKTFWKIAARYYWPNMTQDIRRMTLGCAHCMAANIASHEAQQQLRTFEADNPFDVIVLDIWHPGRAAIIKNGPGSHVLVCIDVMTGFASATFVDSVDSETITRASFTAFFITHGLPKLTIVDAGNEFAGTLKAMCSSMGLPFYTVSRGNHKAILCERFNRYLNKVQRIHAANCETFQDFAIGTIFAVYAWNASPVDGTNVIRAYAAIGREFPFPIDFERDPIVPRETQNQGEQTLNHIDNAFPLWHKQREMLRILNEERREYHRQLKNQGRSMKKFAPGELVLVRKQVNTTHEQGPAKARLKARGPYRVIEEVRPGTYRVQRLPGTRGKGRRGRIVKEAAARMERIPSPLVVHKTTKSIDTRLATYRHAMIDNPLEHTIGLFEQGGFQHADPAQAFAFEKIEDLWHDEVDTSTDEDIAIALDNNDTSSDDSDNSDNDQPSNNYDGNQATTNKNDNITDHPNIEYGNGHDEDNNEETHQQRDINETNCESNTNADAHQGNTTNKTPKQITKSTRKRTHHMTVPMRTATRNIRPPKRYCPLPNEELDNNTSPQDTTQHREESKTPTRKAHQLYNSTRQSRDRLFFIRHRGDATEQYQWYLVQALLEDSDTTATRNEGEYRVRFMIREHSNSKTRPLRNCRYWPEIHELGSNGTPGPIIMIRPGKVDNVLKNQPHKYQAYEREVNLIQHAIVGPFDFALPREYNQEAHRITFEEWETLKARANQYQVDTSNIERTIPLR